MDVEQIIQKFLVAANSYNVQTSESNTKQLRNEFEVLIEISGRSKALFSLHTPTIRDCISALIHLISNVQAREVWVPAIDVLYNFAQEDRMRHCLHNELNVGTILGQVILLSSATDRAVKSALQLLQHLIYGMKAKLNEEVCNFLVKNILSCTQLMSPCLGVLTCMCYHNLPVQSYIKSQDNVKLLYKALTKLLSHSDRAVSIYSLSIITSLCLHDSLCEKLFSSKNINQTCMLVFNILMCDEYMAVRQYAVDLLIDHLKVQYTLNSILSYGNLEMVVRQLACQLNCDHPSTTKLLELMLTFCGVPKLRSLVSHRMLDAAALQESSTYQSRAAPHELGDPFLALVNLARKPADLYQTAPILALRLIRELYEDVIDSGLSEHQNRRSELVLPAATEILMDEVCSDSYYIGLQCQRVVAAIQLLNVMCLDDQLKKQVTSSIDYVTCLKVMDFQLTNNRVTYQGPKSEESDWSSEGVAVLLFMVNFLLRHVMSPEWTERITVLIQDPRLTAFLARGLVSNQRPLIQEALSILTRVVVMPSFSISLLADYLSSANRKARRDAATPTSFMSTSCSPQPITSQPLIARNDKENVPNNPPKKQKVNCSDSEIDSIILRMSSSVNINSSRASDIIEIFQHKLQTFQTKENHLQDVIDAKTQALAQADRLNQHHRGRIAALEGEAHRLTTILREAERSIEGEKERTNDAALQIERMSKKHSKLIRQLEENQDAIAEELKKSDKLEQTIAKLKVEYEALSDIKKIQQNHLDSLNQQMEVKDSDIASLEAEKKQQGKEIKALRIALEEMVRSKEDMAKVQDRQTRELGQLTDAYQELKQKLSVSEGVVENLKCDCAAKDEKIVTLQEALDEHSHIAAMIHNLSSRTTNANLATAPKREKKSNNPSAS